MEETPEPDGDVTRPSGLSAPPRIRQAPRRALIMSVLLGVLGGLILGGGGVGLWFAQQQQASSQTAQAQITTLQQQHNVREQNLQSRIAALTSLREHVEYNLVDATVQYPPQADCKLHSVSDTQRTTVAFRNTSARTVLINWLNYDGNEESFGSLEPGDVLVEATFVTHPWCIRDKANNIILAMTAGEEGQMVRIP